MPYNESVIPNLTINLHVVPVDQTLARTYTCDNDESICLEEVGASGDASEESMGMRRSRNHEQQRQ